MTIHKTDAHALPKAQIELASEEIIHSSENSKTPDLSVVIVSWNAKSYLEKCLQSLSSNISRTLEIIVVDNASTDGSPEMVNHQFPCVKLIQTGQNLGFSKANNIGIIQCRGKYIALINSDVNVLPGCLDQLADFLDDNPNAGMVGPRIMNGDRSQQPSCRHFPNLWNTFCGTFNLYKLLPNSRILSGEQMLHFSYDRICEVEVLSGCFILARRKAVEEFGLLDEDFWMYGEDVDWSRRCTNSGWKVYFTPNGEAIHYGGGSSSNNPVRFEIAQQQARLQLWLKHYGNLTLASFLILLVIHRALRILAAWPCALTGPRRAHIFNKVIEIHIACLRAIPTNLRFIRTQSVNN